MAIDYAKQGVRVNEVLPGATQTGMLSRFALLGGVDIVDLNQEWKDARRWDASGSPRKSPI